MAKVRKDTCPQCGGPAKWEGNPYRPFCSERCRMMDLGQWAMERYRIPGESGRPAEDGEAGRADEEGGEAK